AAMIPEGRDGVAEGRRVVRAVGCMGGPFTADFLAALLQENAQNVVEPLEALIDAEILRSNHEDREARFEFRHALLQRAAYESMVQSERRATPAKIVKQPPQYSAAGPFDPPLSAYPLPAPARPPAALHTSAAADPHAPTRPP